ncbi:hypothetical protein [Chitinophaga agri]|uniref:Outer membrane protein beta-barrel domain-containing protein n=1 Tax=Chitinophaga agri TaxID=2703787 RepID=A0A6B9ZLH9_9BACT|nr:hypothetical protein [Chitinophaga agri]QHS62836.1 hypothetical protein GWR21_25610 [Chitinophaga agri]
MRCCFIFILLLCSQAAMCQSLAELERQLDSLLKKQEKSELIVGVGYGNSPAYGKKTQTYETPVVMKPFLSPNVSYYHKSGLFANVSSYYLFQAIGKPWFEWDFSLGYDYTRNRKFLTGISYTRYIFTDSSDIPVTPINNELFAYFYYRDWWLQPGVSLDLGWGSADESIAGGRLSRTLSGKDFNVVAAVRHPFVFIDVLKHDDAILLTPSVGLTMGTANYYSNLKSFQYISRSPKLHSEWNKHPWRDADGPPVNDPAKQAFMNAQTKTGFEMRAVDLTVNASYVIGKLTISPSYTVFKPFQGDDKSLIGYFTARLGLTFK